MPTTLGSLYRDINSRISDAGVNEQKIFHLDVVKAINDSIREIRHQYVTGGAVEDFLHTETVWVSIEDFKYPFLRYGKLDYDIIHDVPIQQALVQSVVHKTDKKLKDKTQTWTTGDLAIKDNITYEALIDITNENTFDLTFEIDNIKNYRPNNKLTYKVGEVAYHASDDTYWRVISDYTANQGQTPNESGAFEQLKWLKTDDGYYEGSYVDFGMLHQLKLSGCIDNHYPFSVKGNRIYAAEANTPFTISYVPQWEQIEDLSCELDLPDTMIPSVKIRTLQILGSKLNVNIELQMMRQDEENK